jgi:hypothetical protein
MGSLSGVLVALQKAGGDYLVARTPTLSPPEVKKTDEHSPLAMQTSAFGRVLVILVAGLAHRWGA